jgi:uncharacterized protein YjbI with pentapeptide repeats
MADIFRTNPEQVEIINQGAEVWNNWRKNHSKEEIELGLVALTGANLKGINLSDAHLVHTFFIEANLGTANLSYSDLKFAELTSAVLREASFIGADLTQANLQFADLRGAKLWGASLMSAKLRGANLSKADLGGADLSGADLEQAHLHGANLSGANLVGADLSGANLSEANLSGASFIKTVINKVKLSGSSVYGVNVWDLKGEFGEQRDLVITPHGASPITVDNIKVAQFIYLVLNNEEIRDIINTLTSKSVLILGRFAIPERKVILDALRDKLREYNLLPIVFDFDRPTEKDFTETIKTLAGLCYFVIADVTNPKSSPLELQATVPDYQIPFVPIIQEGEQPFAMMVDLQKKYNWVLDTLSYKSIDELIRALKPAIIDPAIEKHNELRLIKAREPKIRSASDFIEDKGMGA